MPQKLTAAAVASIIHKLVKEYRRADTPEAVKQIAKNAERRVARLGRSKCARNEDYWLWQAQGSAHNQSLMDGLHKEDLAYVLYSLSKARLILQRDERLMAILRAEDEVKWGRLRTAFRAEFG